MAKKKSKKHGGAAQQQRPVSPEKYIIERARKLPVDKCYINSNYKEEGIGNVIVTRKRGNGTYVAGIFLTDLYCLGVKDVLYYHDLNDDELKRMLSRAPEDHEYMEISYNEAHNIIYGSIEFAEEAEVEPCKDFEVAQYILEPDDDNIPLIDIEFGREGKHLLVVGPSGKERKYINTLKKKLGDNFEFSTPYDDFVEGMDGEDFDDEYEEVDEEDMDDLGDEYDDDDLEVYSYERPAYPASLNVRHKFLIDEVFKLPIYPGPSQETQQKVDEIPEDELAEDSGNYILYEIGRTYREIEEMDDDERPSDDHGILNAALCIYMSKSDKGLPAMLELLRQSKKFIWHYFGNTSSNVIPQVLYVCGKDHVDKITEYLETPGFDFLGRMIANKTLGMIYAKHPERQGEIKEIFRKRLNYIAKNLPQNIGCDRLSAENLLAVIYNLKIRGLDDEIRAVFSTGFRMPGESEVCENLIEEINSDEIETDIAQYQMDLGEAIEFEASRDKE